MSEHLHTTPRNPKPLWLALGVTATFMMVEIVGGLYTGSLALLSDAAHMVTDAASLGFSLFALWIGQKQPGPKQTFGYQRTEVLAALANAMTLWLMVGALFYEAYQRFLHPPEIKALPMLVIAVVGLLANVGSGLFLMKASREDINLRSAFIHVVYDAASSLAVIIAALVLWMSPDHGWIDPVLSVLICALVLAGSWGLIRDSIHILMEGTPKHLNAEKIRLDLCALPGVTEIHDLHLWTIAPGVESVSGHVGITATADTQVVLDACLKRLEERYSLKHATLQVERKR